MTHYDVAVVGYGPTGVTAANLLGAQGLKVVVVERDADIYTRARAISTDEEVLRIWQQAGLAEELERDMLPDRPIAFVDSRGKSFLDAAFTPAGHGYPPQLFIYQPTLEQTLRAGVKRFPNVDVLLEQECVGVRQDPDGVELRLAGDKLIRASWLIAADGGSSFIRGLLGIGFEGRTYTDRWIVVDTEVHRDWPGQEQLRFHCDPRRPAVDCPAPLGHHRWEFPVLRSEDPQELVTETAVWRLLNTYGITERDVTILRAVIYKHHVRFASRWRVGRIFLAGDAAHAMPPWIGQGMAAGVRDVANLCWKLAAVVSGQLPESILDSYETERKPHVRAVTRRAVFVGRLITERRLVVTKLRDVLFRTVGRVPWARRQMVKQSWIPESRYRRGLLDPVPGKAVGRKIPQPWVLDSSGVRRRLDDVTAGRWTILSTSPQDSTHFTVLPPGSASEPGCVVDIDGVLTAWMRRHRAKVLVLRPDNFVYGDGPGAIVPQSNASPIPPPTTAGGDR